MKRLIFVFIALFAVASVNAQSDAYFKKKKDKNGQRGSHFEEKKYNWGDAIYAYVSSKYRPFGWHLDPGITYMIGNSPSTDEFRPSGLPGYYVGIGMQHLFKKVDMEQDPASPFYIDYGLGIKHFGGREVYKATDGTKTSANFNFGSLFARANFHGVIQLRPWMFIDQSLGVNFDYRIYGGKQTTNNGSGTSEGKMVLGLNYTFGWGWKIRDGFFVVPTLQMPVMKFISWQGFNPSHVWFNSRYEPAILTLKFAWLFPKKGCPPVFNNETDQDRSKKYQMQ